MNILIITQSIDKRNPTLGFFHTWVIEFSKRFDRVTVICLEKGEFDLPGNVTVLSLGKEKGVSKIKYVFNFYKYIWQQRMKYDSVFVHMNQEYIILGFLLWKLLNKKIGLWRNHPKGTMFTRLAVFLSSMVFCTSEFSFTKRFKETQIMPVGIDTNFFLRDVTIKSVEKSILYLGRVAPVKNVHIIIDALDILNRQGIIFSMSIFGDTLPKDLGYFNLVQDKVLNYGLKDFVTFNKGVPNSDTPYIYSSHNVFVNLTENGSLDKTIFEAMSCDAVVVTSNMSLKNDLEDGLFVHKIDPVALADSLAVALGLDDNRKSMREYVVKNHSLIKLLDEISDCYKN